jgi:hypothetical protein
MRRGNGADYWSATLGARQMARDGTRVVSALKFQQGTQDNEMTKQYSNVAVAIFADHAAAEDGVKKLTAAGFDAGTLSVIGKGYHTEEKVLGFYNMGDRMKVWGSQGAVWGGLWGLLFGGLFVMAPLTGPVMILGYLGAVAVTTIEGVVLGGGISALFAALASIGIPRDSVLRYETAVKADDFLVMVHGTADDVARARTILAAAAKSVDIHSDLVAPAPGQLAA